MTRRIALATCVALAWLPLHAQDGPLFRAMQDEMRRSMQDLRLGDMQQPYFIAYRVVEDRSVRVAAALGSVTSSREGSSRLLSVELRVGDASFDNTNFYSRSSFGPSLGRLLAALPLEDDYGELRRKIWLATDGAYKRALDQLSKKRAALQNATRVDESPDFSAEEPHQHADDQAADELRPERAEQLAREISAVFAGMPHLYVSGVEVDEVFQRVSYLNSEGTSFVRASPSIVVRMLAGTQADDGTPLEDSVTARARSWPELPPASELLARARDLADGLGTLREATVFDRYTGPVLFEGQAAAALVRSVLAPRLLAVKPPVADDPRMASALGRSGNPFVDKLGSRVLPRFLSLTDDPTADMHDGEPLLGGYAVDDDGVPARETALVQRGILKMLLASRNPVQGVPASTGNRRGLGPAPSNLFVTARDGLAPDELREELMALLEERELEFGIVVRRIGDPPGRISRQGRVGGPSGSGSRSEIGAAVAYKVYPDGREEPIRQATLGVSDADFRDIVAASVERTVHSVPPRGGGVPIFGAFVGPIPVASYVVPDLLFEDLTVRRPRGNIPRPPVVPHPSAD